MGIDIEDYYTRYGPMVLRRCRFLLQDEDRALDAMQEVFVKLLMKKESLTGTAPSSLLYTIATNVCLNIIRSERRGTETGSNTMLETIASHDDSEEKLLAGDILDRLFSREKAGTREIAVMHYVDGMTLQQVAEESGLSVSGVRKRLRNLREKAKDYQEFQYEI